MTRLRGVVQIELAKVGTEDKEDYHYLLAEMTATIKEKISMGTK